MTAVISSTGDPKYFFFIPISTWCWNRLGVDVVCFMPTNQGPQGGRELGLLNEVIDSVGLKIQVAFFNCPEDKEATYAQCSRLYAGALDLPEDEILITSDADMLPLAGFNDFINGPSWIPKEAWDITFTIIGTDLVPPNQYPMCYAKAPVKVWNSIMAINGRTSQECLDAELGGIECENMKANYWAKDQELLWNNSRLVKKIEINRAIPGTQFADLRLDRDDAYLLDRLKPETVDYHMPRPGHEEKAFNQILTVLQYFYPNDSFEWLISYREAYIKLL